MSKEDEIRRAIEEAEREDREEAKNRAKQDKKEAKILEKQEKDRKKDDTKASDYNEKRPSEERKKQEERGVSRKPLYFAFILVIAGVFVILFTGGFLPLPFSFTANTVACGSVNETHIFMARDQLTAGESASMECFSSKLTDCAPATFELTGVNGRAYEIRGIEGTNCLVSDGEKTCSVPRSAISGLAESSRSVGVPEMAFAPVVAAMAVPENVTIRNSVTGEIIQVYCV